MSEKKIQFDDEGKEVPTNDSGTGLRDIDDISPENASTKNNKRSRNAKKANKGNNSEQPTAKFADASNGADATAAFAADEFAGIPQGTDATTAFSSQNGYSMPPQNENINNFSRASYNKNDNNKAKKKFNKKKALIITGATIGGIALVAGILAAIFTVNADAYEGKFLPNTTINGINVEGLNADEATEKANAELLNATTSVHDGDDVITITGDDIEMTLVEEEIAAFLESQNKWDWLDAKMNGGKAYTVGTEYNTEKLTSAVDALDCVSGKDRIDPVNASVVWNSDSGSFEVVEEQQGTKADREAILSAITECVENGGGEVDASTFFSAPTITSDSEAVQNAVNTANSWIDKTITYNIDGIDNAETLNSTDIAEFITISDDMTVGFNDEAISSWLSEIGKEYDTAGTSRTYTTVWGKTVTISAGSSTYGWVTDEASMLSVVKENIQSSETNVDQDFKYQQTAAGAKGSDEWGSFYIDLDKTDQKVRVVKDGEVIFEAITVTGSYPNHVTPNGIWSVLDKKTDYTMTGEIDPDTGEPEYVTPCDYWIRFTWAGHGFHDATWRSNWSSTAWKAGNGSHGCANMKLSDVKELYSLVSVGTPVIVHD